MWPSRSRTGAGLLRVCSSATGCTKAWLTPVSLFLLPFQGKYAEADPLYLRAIEIGEKTLGPDHPELATRLNNRAGLLAAQVRDQGHVLEVALGTNCL